MRTLTKATFKQWQALPEFPLTPALSGWERENRSPAFRKTMRGDNSETLEQPASVRLLFPLHQGKGQGEDESYKKPPTNFLDRHD
jgi:hypothetical protein